MIAALLFLLPISIGGAISPMMLTEQTVLLGTQGRRAATKYAAGAILTLLLIVVVLVVFGQVISLPTAPTLSASLDLILGVAVLLIGGAIQYLGHHPFQLPRPHRHADQEHRSHASLTHAALPFGAFSMATNFTTLAIAVVASKEIAGAGVSTLGRIVLIVVLVTICSLPAWAPLALTQLAPRRGGQVLDRFGQLIDVYGRIAIVVLLIAAGLFLIVRGILGL